MCWVDLSLCINSHEILAWIESVLILSCVRIRIPSRAGCGVCRVEPCPLACVFLDGKVSPGFPIGHALDKRHPSLPLRLVSHASSRRVNDKIPFNTIREIGMPTSEPRTPTWCELESFPSRKGSSSTLSRHAKHRPTSTQAIRAAVCRVVGSVRDGYGWRKVPLSFQIKSW